MNEKGKLYLVATPIGNLEDMTLRALRILKEVDIIAAEDTRHTIKLLNHYEIKIPMTSYFEHNKIEKGNYLVKQLLEGKNIALVSDAGTPGISDPGEDLVKLALENSIEVTMIPGPAAVVMGLVLSGFTTSRFIFEGFLPMNKKFRKERIKTLKNETRTIIMYEAPHKLSHTLKALYEEFGNRNIALARELTKKFEEVIHCTLEEAINKYSVDQPKGEFVLVLEALEQSVLDNEKKKSWENMSIEQHLDYYMIKGINKKDAIKKVAEDRGLSKREVYNDNIMNQKVDS